MSSKADHREQRRDGKGKDHHRSLPLCQGGDRAHHRPVAAAKPSARPVAAAATSAGSRSMPTAWVATSTIPTADMATRVRVFTSQHQVHWPCWHSALLAFAATVSEPRNYRLKLLIHTIATRRLAREWLFCAPNEHACAVRRYMLFMSYDSAASRRTSGQAGFILRPLLHLRRTLHPSRRESNRRSADRQLPWVNRNHPHWNPRSSVAG